MNIFKYFILAMLSISDISAICNCTPTHQPSRFPTPLPTPYPTQNTTNPTSQPVHYITQSQSLTTTATNSTLVTALTVSSGVAILMALIYSIIKFKFPTCFSKSKKPPISNSDRI